VKRGEATTTNVLLNLNPEMWKRLKVMARATGCSAYRDNRGNDVPPIPAVSPGTFAAEVLEVALIELQKEPPERVAERMLRWKLDEMWRDREFDREQEAVQ